ncbi:MAG: biotin--[acetyl-CoA-carboxylase] ligase [Chlamydiota bacterium]
MKNIIPIEFDSIDSTHAFVKRNYLYFPAHFITRVTATAQTAGKGRTNKRWISPPHQNIYISYFLTLNKAQPDLSNLAQVVAVTAAEWLEHYRFHPQIKWPNDLLIQGKKVAGALCEWIDMKTQLGAILSLGINVNMDPSQLEIIDQPATSMYAASGQRYSIKDLISQLDLSIAVAIEHYKRAGFRFFYLSYDSYLIGKGNAITYFCKGATQEAILDSLNADGRLNIRLKTGEVHTVSSGEIESIRCSEAISLSSVHDKKLGLARISHKLC